MIHWGRIRFFILLLLASLQECFSVYKYFLFWSNAAAKEHNQPFGPQRISLNSHRKELSLYLDLTENGSTTVCLNARNQNTKSQVHCSRFNPSGRRRSLLFPSSVFFFFFFQFFRSLPFNSRPPSPGFAWTGRCPEPFAISQPAFIPLIFIYAPYASVCVRLTSMCVWAKHAACMDERAK